MLSVWTNHRHDLPIGVMVAGLDRPRGRNATLPHKSAIGISSWARLLAKSREQIDET